jgi:penicillin-binding protein 2
MGVYLDAHDVDHGDQEPQHLQSMAREFGFGSLTEIDLRGEQEGLVGDQEWKWHRFSYAQTIDRRWFAGDNVNLSIGQGFLQVTPLQLASAYAAITNGGVLYRPRVLKCVAQLDVSQRVDPDQACAQGTVPRSAAPKILNRIPAPSGSLDFMEESMVGTQVGDGTAASAFSGFPFDQVYISGKTGTAQSPQQPFSWYAAIARSGDKEMVVVAMVEEAGTGSQIAAPIARRVIERHFDIEESTFEVGARTD